MVMMFAASACESIIMLKTLKWKAAVNYSEPILYSCNELMIANKSKSNCGAYSNRSYTKHKGCLTVEINTS